jgi:hypothetical protein
MRALTLMATLLCATAPAGAADLPAQKLPAPGIAHGCALGVWHASTLESASRMCPRPLAMTIIAHPHHPALHT